MGIILGVIFFYPVIGFTGLAWGVIFGAILHVAIQLPVVSVTGLFPRMSKRFNTKAVREVVMLSLPRTVALSTSLVSLIAITAIASTIYKGSIAVFNLSFNL